MGWTEVVYVLSVEPEDETGRPVYEVREETEYLGPSSLLRTGDREEVAG